MAIHSIDNKTEGTQDSSMSAIPSSTTTGIQPQIPGNSSNVPQVLVGYQKDGFGSGVDQGIKVSRQGVSVDEATDSQLIMSSAFNSFKIVASGVTTLSKPPGQYTSTTSITHGQPKAPIFMAYFAYGTGYTPIPFTAINSLGVGVLSLWVSSDPTSITIELNVPPGAPYDALDLTGSSALVIRYYILVETAATS